MKIVTKEGYKKLKDELYCLKKVKLPEIAEKIRAAKELGDLSENAEYAAAKEEQTQVNTRIAEIRSLLKGVDVVDVKDKKAGIVSIGSDIVLMDKNKKTYNYSIVGSNESDPMKGKISNESPIGAACLGHLKGEKINVKLPDREMEYEIVEIN